MQKNCSFWMRMSNNAMTVKGLAQQAAGCAGKAPGWGSRWTRYAQCVPVKASAGEEGERRDALEEMKTNT